ncbi:hypothetical protein [Streptomyces sp. NPDC001604]|uniref:hypothetical protein n=1 Tax=Streptomyces sp. NPDC001604 TaxID=3364593 RepID=UPI00368F38D5
MGTPLALVGHAPGAMRHCRTPVGTPLVAGRKVTRFTDSEEEVTGLTKVMPFLVEDELSPREPTSPRPVTSNRTW